VSESTNHVYVLFPTGGILMDNIYNNVTLNFFLDQLIEDLIKHKSETTKYVLAGHSMGAVLASYLGLRIFKSNPDFFSRYCIVIGSAPFKFLSIQDRAIFTNLDNVFIFVCGKERRRSKNSDKKQLLLDKYVNLLTDSSLSNYQPYYIVVYEGEDQTGEKIVTLYDTRNIQTILDKYSDIQYIENQFLSKMYHAWSNYYDLFFNILYDIETKMIAAHTINRQIVKYMEKKRKQRIGGKTIKKKKKKNKKNKSNRLRRK
jgi:hypothetical protein